MLNKTANSLQFAFLALIIFYRGHLKVVRTISSDHEAVFKSCALFLEEEHGANYPGEHEVDAERGMRGTTNQATRAQERGRIRSGRNIPVIHRNGLHQHAELHTQCPVIVAYTR